MGLDQHLMAEQRLTKHMDAHRQVLGLLTEDQRSNLADSHAAYVSGWEIGNMRPDPAYATLVELTGMVPTGWSPHFNIVLEGDDLLVQACCAYWRKANQIHNWFVQNIADGADDCALTRPINGEELADLMDRCKQVLDTPVLAAKLLPTVSGFFFGSTEYDEWYVQDLKDTVDQLNLVYETYPKPLVLRYRASW